MSESMKSMALKPPGRIVIEADVAHSPLVETLRRNLPHAGVSVVDRVQEKAVHDPDVLEVVRFRGRFLKSCPGTRQYNCCGYRILHFGLQCSLDCTYCILQAYLNQPNLRLFGNTDDLFEELAAEIDTHPGQLYRIGTGEFTDSLLLDPWTGFSRPTVRFFASRANAVLELKTKTDYIGNLRDLDHRGHTIVAWSLNAESVRWREETKSATLRQRFDAARTCAELGYALAFHFDPMLEFPRWKEEYGETLARLFDAVDPARVVWISLGAFRFMPELKSSIRSRHPDSRITCGEFIPGLDGKMRYFRDIRVEMYSFMVDRIRAFDPELCTYLCMEGNDIWRDAFGFTPAERGGLGAMLDRAVLQRMKVGATF
ncbi:SPL family radical SAM protein [Syntrophobacter fumaroxidans]|uniref:SPL family radical SAM protein n=1 Tax=Syntrophobacter fumaroxidans TaxID=119484 RepID=UPI0002DD748E|nr:DNA photolyase [Syntrophobacter fumaroxidans]